jgi:hypothetical protein
MKTKIIAILILQIIILFINQLYGQPYPPSSIISKIEWDEEVHKITWGSGDNWPITWVNDTLQITSYGDGDGFDEENQDLSLGFSYIIGDPPDLRGKDFQSNIDTREGQGPNGIKTSGIIMVDGILYIYVRNYKSDKSNDFTNSRLAWSEDFGRSFQWAEWYFSNTFGCPDFIQFGPDYSGALDKYVYIVSQDNDNAYRYSSDIVLARVTKDKIEDRNAYEFFAGNDSTNNPEWTTAIKNREAIFTDPLGTQRVAVTYNSALGRFILTTSHQPENDNRTHTAALGVFESEFPWGNWKTIYYDDNWSNECRTYHHKFPTKWMSNDGKEMWLLFSGLDCGYYDFCVRKAKLTIDR